MEYATHDLVVNANMLHYMTETVHVWATFVIFHDSA
jgi:hypothetical protein